MLIKILLALSILGSGAAIFFAKKHIEPKILGLNVEIRDLGKTLGDEKDEHKKTTEVLESTELLRATLAQDKSVLERELADEKQLRELAENAKRQAKSSEQSALQKANSIKLMNDGFWDLNKDLKLTPAKIRSEHKELPKVKSELSTIKEENKILLDAVNKAQGLYEITINPNMVAMQPSGIRGRVVGVDPKWRFVILNIGSSHGVRHGGELSVTRGGRFIGRLKVSSVESAHSIANMMDDYDADEDGVQEGDEVVAPNRP